MCWRRGRTTSGPPGASAATLARTPAMRPQDHTSHSRTVLHVAADGSVTGETHESATGALAIALRGAAAAVQNLGGEAAARRVLQGFGTPGTGSFDLSHVAEPIDPPTSRLVCVGQNSGRPAPGRAGVPFGMPLLTRPGNFLLPPRLSGRASAFVCYAGEQRKTLRLHSLTAFPCRSPHRRCALTSRSSPPLELQGRRAHAEDPPGVRVARDRPILCAATGGADRGGHESGMDPHPRRICLRVAGTEPGRERA